VRPPPDPLPPGEGDIALISASASLLFANGQTTHRTLSDVERVAFALGRPITVLADWDHLTIRFAGHNEHLAVAPTAVEMHKVASTIETIDKVCAGRIDPGSALQELDAIARLPPVSLMRFAVMAGLGAAALGVIFGSSHWLSLVLIAISAGAGACVRRWLAGITHNAFVQPLGAAVLAGIIGAVTARAAFSSSLLLIAVCPCMVLVPGPHLLNGAIDLVRARIALGIARLVFAGIIVLMICTGLLGGLALGGVSLPVSGSSAPVPLVYDVLAAGVAVAAYGTFFSMRWRALPVPVVIGMVAHATRWAAITVMGASVEAGALVACLFVGAVVTPIADKMRMPFAAFAFASVVSLIPGVYLFRMASGLVALASRGQASPSVLLDTIADGSTAMLIIIAMTFGLIVPKMCIESFYPHKTEQPSLADASRRDNGGC
jgi:uncharacterized membrane protein YjjP (DUF1212 family)